MAGHSQFKNIMYRKGAQDKKRAKIFTKIIRELTTAARTGLPDPNANPRLRAAFTKAGGSLGESNSVSFQFDRLGEVVYPVAVASADAMFEAAVEAGADNVEGSAEQHTITCAADDLNAVRDALEQRFGPAQSAKLVWRPKTSAPVAGDAADALLKLLETLEDSDDVQTVYANFEMADDVLQRLSA